MDGTTEITVSIPVKQAIQTHVEHLQATLAKRNAEIERLTARVADAEAGEPNQRAIEAAYKRGWQAASGLLMEVSRKAAIDLGSIRKDAWEIYLQAEKRDFDGHHQNG